MTFWNCSYMSRRVKTPCESFWYSSGCLSRPASLIAFISLCANAPAPEPQATESAVGGGRSACNRTTTQRLVADGARSISKCTASPPGR
eukprot:2987661-Rhodomonas_salina.1